jgi:hypothetical protein
VKTAAAIVRLALLAQAASTKEWVLTLSYRLVCMVHPTTMAQISGVR